MEAADVAANRAARRDEAEVLKSIYGEDCVFHNDNSCEILVRPSEEGGIVPLRLCIHFPESYPVTSEPILEMEAPWLKQEIRQKLSRELQTIYQENAGCVVVFTWVEWIKSHMRVSPSDARTVTWGWRWVNMLWEVKISALPAGVKETDGTAEFATVQQSKFDFVFPLKSHRIMPPRRVFRPREENPTPPVGAYNTALPPDQPTVEVEDFGRDKNIKNLLKTLQPKAFTREGADVPKELEEWVMAMEDYFVLAGYNSLAKGIMGSAKLEGPAKLWRKLNCASRGVSEHSQSWDDLKERLRERYLPLNYSTLKMNEFLSCTRKGKTIEEYHEEFVKLSRHAPLMSEEQKLSRFILGLEGKLADEVESLRPTSLADALVRAKSKLNSFTGSILGRCANVT
ncbi:hypothetical protein L7F22_021693 [Adiantum nelumboides]|nr:hypothetical protein [Adiantum nelumboides]